MKLFEFFKHCPLVDTMFEGLQLSKDTNIADTLKYNNWTIKVLTSPDSQGLYAAMGFHDRNPSIPRTTADTAIAAVNMVKSKIDTLASADNQSMMSAKVTIDFNVEFTKQVIADLGQPTGVRFENRSGSCVMIVASVEYASMGSEIFGNSMEQFTKFHKRKTSNSHSSTATMGYCCSMNGSRATALGLVGNGRYTLKYQGSDDYQNQEYQLVFDSITSSKSDKRRLSVPGLTVALS